MIKNIVFDVGNVLVQWDPISITKRCFPTCADPLQLSQQLFKSTTWQNLNLGKISEQEAMAQYQAQLALDNSQQQLLMQSIRASLVPVEGGIELLKKLHQASFSLYSLTDNVKEIMKYLKQQYDFWPLFSGIVVSAEIGHLKPAPEIYHHLLSQYHLNAHETLFLDDHLPNVAGAQSVGMHAIQFINTPQCITALAEMGINSI